MSCSRRDFLLTSLGAGALLAVGPGCHPPVAPDGIVMVKNGQVTLSFSEFPRLKEVGGGVTVGTEAGTPFAVVRTGTSTALAINAVCTHEGCTAVYHQTPGDLECDCHGSKFRLDGTVLMGPAKDPLSMTYPAVVGTDGITVTIPK
jgi:Rieske Fe-S protein